MSGRTRISKKSAAVSAGERGAPAFAPRGFAAAAPRQTSDPAAPQRQSVDLLGAYLDKRRAHSRGAIHTTADPVIQRYPPIELEEDQWWEETVGQIYFSEKEAIEAYLAWTEKKGEKEDPTARKRLAELEKGQQAEAVKEEAKKKEQVEQYGEHQEEPPVFLELSVANQQVLLVGTKHGAEPEKDLSGKIPKEKLANAAVVIEFPPLRGTGRRTFSQQEIESTKFGILDLTQRALAQLGPSLVEQGTVLIGADGRKNILLSDGRVHGLSLRNKEDKKYQVTQELIDDRAIFDLGQRYVLGALELSESTIGGVVTDLSRWIRYQEEAMGVILAKSSGHLRFLASHLPQSERLKIQEAVLNKLGGTLAKEVSDYKENLQQAEAEPGAILRRTNEERLGAFYDAVCDVMLFTEVLASREQNIVVAFGNEHVKPLQGLLEQVKAMRESQ